MKSCGEWAPWARALLPSLVLGSLLPEAAAILPDSPAGPPQSAKPRPPATERPVPAAPARQGTLLVESDASCELSIDGTRQQTLSPGKVVSISVGAGEALIDCVSTEVPAVRARQVKKVEVGGKMVVGISLGEEVNRAKAADEQRRKADDERRNACANPRNVMDQGGGVLRQCGSGLEWTQADNGYDSNWIDASRWCGQKGGSWRLPTVDELLSLYDASGGLSTRCGQWTCKVSPRFDLTNLVFWTGDREGSSGAWYVGLVNGARLTSVLGDTYNLRALCVRRS